VGVVESMSHVVRCTEMENGAGAKFYHIGVAFDKMPLQIVNKLVRYLFTVQRQTLAKGVGI